MFIKTYHADHRMETIIEAAFNPDERINYHYDHLLNKMTRMMMREYRRVMVSQLMNDKKFQKKLMRDAYKKLMED